MKKISLATGVLLVCMAAYAQRGEPVDPQKDQKNFQGYLIKLLPAMGGTYGYAIVKGKELIALQNRNPFTNMPEAFSTKEDASKVAQWQISELAVGRPGSAGITVAQGKPLNLPPSLLQKLQMRDNRGPRINQQMPRKIADKLKIRIHN